MDECIDWHGEGTVFSTLDAHNGYWQIEILLLAKMKMHSFPTLLCIGLYVCYSEPATHPVHCSVPYTCSYPAVTCTSPVLTRWCTHISQKSALTLRSCTNRPLANAQRRLHNQIKKCNLFTDTIGSLSDAIYPKRFEIASHTTDAICRLKPPSDLTDLTLILVLGNFFQRFVSSFA